MLYVYMEGWIQGFSSRVSRLNIIMADVVSLVVSNVASLGVRRAIDVIAGVCSRICHHYVGLCLRGGGAVGGRRRGHRGRRGRRGGGRVVEAQVRDVEACVVPLDDVVVPAGDVSETVFSIENEVA